MYCNKIDGPKPKHFPLFVWMNWFKVLLLHRIAWYMRKWMRGGIYVIPFEQYLGEDIEPFESKVIWCQS